MADISELEVGMKVKDIDGDVGKIVLKNGGKVGIKYIQNNNNSVYNLDPNKIYMTFPFMLEIVEEPSLTKENNKEELLMENLYGSFSIIKKDNGYVVSANAEGHEAEIVCTDYADGIRQAVEDIVSKIKYKEEEKQWQKNRIQILEEELAELKGE